MKEKDYWAIAGAVMVAAGTAILKYLESQCKA